MLAAEPRPLVRLRKICLALPEVHEVRSHGEPTFRVKNKMFATYANADNHHGRGRHGVWIKAAPGRQARAIKAGPGAILRAALRRSERMGRCLPRCEDRLEGARRHPQRRVHTRRTEETDG
jgi:hypothetical protein